MKQLILVLLSSILLFSCSVSKKTSQYKCPKTHCNTKPYVDLPEEMPLADTTDIFVVIRRTADSIFLGFKH